MAEQLLNGLDMGSVLEQVLCESMSQCVRRHTNCDPRPSCAMGQGRLNAVSIHMPAHRVSGGAVDAQFPGRENVVFVPGQLRVVKPILFELFNA